MKDKSIKKAVTLEKTERKIARGIQDLCDAPYVPDEVKQLMTQLYESHNREDKDIGNDYGL